MQQMHEIQLGILRNLLFTDNLRYTDLKPDAEMENNQFNFHLKKLINAGYVGKSNGLYTLTNKGKEYSNRMDTDEVSIERQANLSAWLCCRMKINSDYKYLIYTRLKQPFYGCQGFPTGKIKYGEKIIDASTRELKEETGLEGRPKIVTIKHYLVRDIKTKKLLEDKFMYMCLFENPKGKLRSNSEGTFEWVNEKDLKRYVNNHFESWSAFKKQVEMLKNYQGEISLFEEDHYSSKF